jgi:CRISPR/Cas system-associated protein Cas5 (RAMP superfamily)
VRKETRVLAVDVEIGDHVIVDGEEWEVTDVIDRDKHEQIHLLLSRWTDDNEVITELFVLDADEEIG